jgi:hypothetical protein
MKKILILNILFVLSFLSVAQVKTPTDLSVKILGEGNYINIALTWQFGDQNSVVRYNIYKREGGVNDSGKYVKTYTVYNKKYIANYVTVGKTYSYYVTAVTSLGESQPSNKIEVTAIAPQAKYGVVSGVLKNEATLTRIVKGSARLLSVDGIGWGLNDNVSSDKIGFFKTKTGRYNMYSSAAGYAGEYYKDALYVQSKIITVNENDSLIYSSGLKEIVTTILNTFTGSVKTASGAAVNSSVTAYLVSKHFILNPLKLAPYYTKTDDYGAVNFLKENNTTVVSYIFSPDISYLNSFCKNSKSFGLANEISVTGIFTGINYVLSAKPVVNNASLSLLNNSGSITGLECFLFANKKSSIGITGYLSVIKTESLTGNYIPSFLTGEYI